MLPIHLIVQKKIELILQSRQFKSCPDLSELSDHDVVFVNKLAKKLKASREDVTLAMQTLHCEERNFVLPYIIERGGNLFKDSFQNPLSAQGLIILGYIVNTVLLVLRKRLS